MTVADLAREAARRYVDTMPIADWARGLLEQLGVPPAGRAPACVAELVSVWRRVLGPALVEHFSIPELNLMARFYSTPEGASILRTEVACRTAATPALARDLVTCARAIAARVRPQAAAGEVTP
jgi:hypothetical protein